jgi:thiopurine S-methyltransferase
MEGGYDGLIRHWETLDVSESDNVLVPLCGKSVDMVWMAGRCGSVTGVETAGEAVEAFFREQKLSPEISKKGRFEIYRAGNIELWKGNFFDFPESRAPEYKLIYDKAALVALPQVMRERYAKKLTNLTSGKTRILLHHFIYNQDEMAGPPFSVSPDEIEELFGGFSIQVLEKQNLNPGDFSKFRARGLHTKFSERLLLLKKMQPGQNK